MPTDADALATYRSFLVGPTPSPPPRLPEASDEPQAIIEGVLAGLAHPDGADATLRRVLGCVGIKSHVDAA